MKGLLKIYFLIFIFVIFTTYNSKNDKESVSIIFPIKEIFIENSVATNILKLKLMTWLKPMKIAGPRH